MKNEKSLKNISQINLNEVSRWALETIAKENMEKEREEIKATLEKLQETIGGRTLVIEDCYISRY